MQNRGQVCFYISEHCSIYALFLSPSLWLSLFFCSAHNTCTRSAFYVILQQHHPTHSLSLKKCNPSPVCLRVDFSNFRTECLLSEGASICLTCKEMTAQAGISRSDTGIQCHLRHPQVLGTPPRAGRYDTGPAGHLRSSGAAAGDQVRYSRASQMALDACIW